MSNYTKATNFASKDTLPVGDSNKKVKGSEIDTEFNAISDAIATKADKNGPTFTGLPLAPTAAAGTNTTQIATTEFVGTALTNDKASPAFTGTPTAPTAATGTSTNQIATTAFVGAAVEKSGHVDTSQLADDAVTTAKISPTGVTAGTYGSSSAIPAITVNAEGQVTSATTAALVSRYPVLTTETELWASGSFPSSFTKYSFAKNLTNNLNVGYFHIEAWSATAPTGGGTTYVQVSNNSGGSPFVEARADQSGSLGRDDATNTTKSEIYVFINLTEDPSNSNNWAVWIKAVGGGTSKYGRVALTGYM
jgi:hypothetical protein